MSEIIHFLESYPGLLEILVIGLAELLVRFFPTKSKAGAVERIGSLLRSFFDLLKLPNKEKK